MKKIVILILALTFGTGCRHEGKPFDASWHTFVDTSGGTAKAVVLTPTQASNLLALLRKANQDKVNATGQVNPNIPGPQLAPTLCVNVYADTKRSKYLGQILGFERKWIVMADKVISETNTVEAVYRTIGR